MSFSIQISEDLIASEDELVASCSKHSFYFFVQEFWNEVVTDPPDWNWHIEYICDELQLVAERVIHKQPKEYDLIINVSPGSTKTTLCSIFLPAWLWTRNPALSFIGGSYADSLAGDASRKNRALVECDKYQRCFPWVRLAKDQNVKTHFVTRKKGERIQASTGSKVTGRHADMIVIDDPLNPEEAASDADRYTANNWIKETLPSRCRNAEITPIILIMQRLHQDDCTQTMIDIAKEIEKRTGNYPLKHICLPAEETDDIQPEEVREKYVDGLMNPNRLPKRVLEAKKATSMYVYAGQYLQTPIPAGGGMFHTDKIIIEPCYKSFKKIVRFWDKAGTLKGGCWTVGVKMALDVDNHFWILDIVRGQWDSARREAIIRSTAELDGKEVEIGVEQEGGSGGKESAENTVKNLRGFNVFTERPTGDKEFRADPYSSQVNNNNVSMIPAEWNKPYVDELKFFPNSKYKDQVDASSGAFKRLTRTGVVYAAGWDNIGK